MIHENVTATGNKTSFAIEKQSWMVPSVDVIVYLTHENEIIYDRLKLNVDPEKSVSYNLIA